MKKKIMAIALCVALLAVAIVGASLAYFTDTDNATNTFTVGNIDITLNELFDANNARLLPGSSSTTAVQKEVTITLEDGSEDAYVWYEWLIPSALDDVNSASNNILHVNSYGYTWDDYKDNPSYWPDGMPGLPLPLEQTWDHDPDEEISSVQGPNGFLGTETIDGIEYNKYLVLYHGKLTAGDVTTPGMKQAYLDKRVDTNAAGQYTFNGNVIDFDFTNGIKIIVRAYGIQADGFANVYAAYTAYNTP